MVTDMQLWKKVRMIGSAAMASCYVAKLEKGEVDQQDQSFLDTSTVRDVCAKLHRDFLRKFRYARVKGPSAKFDWQRVGLDHLLKDDDILTIILRKS